MKKQFRIFFLFITAAIFSSCTWQVPKSVSLKTAATYNFSIGEIKKDFSSMFSKDSLLDSSFSNNNGSEIKDYYPGKKSSLCQKYLMKIPVQDIPIDFTTYFNETTLAGNISGLSFDKRFTIPNINLGFSENLDISSMKTVVNGLGQTVIPGTPTGTSIPLTFGTSVSTIKYKTGQLNITGASGATVVTLKNSSGAQVAQASVSGGNATLNLAGKTVANSGMTLEFDNLTGSENVTASSVEVEEITGYNGSSIPIPINTNITTGSSSDFNNCVIDSGYLELNLSLPGWSGATFSYTPSITGSITNIGSITDPSTNVKKIDLTGSTITPGSATLSASGTLSFTNATINFSSTPKIIGTGKIDKFTSVSMTLAGVQTNLNQNENVSEQMINTIATISLAGSGLKGTYINTLPNDADNKIQLQGQSSFVGLAATTTDLNPGTTSNTNFSLLSTATEAAPYNITFPDPENKPIPSVPMDFKVDVLLPGATNANPNDITVKDVVPGAEYQIKMQLEPAINWTQISLYSQGTRTTPASISTGLNVSMLFSAFSSVMGSDFTGKATLKQLPIHIYAVRPDMDCFKTAKFTGNLSFDYRTPDATGNMVAISAYGKETLLDDTSSDPSLKEMPFVDKPVLNEEDGIVISNIADSPASKSGDLSAICNNAKNDTLGCMYVNYELQFSNEGATTTGSQINGKDVFTINYNEYKSSHTSSSSISIMAYIELPLNFGLIDDVAIDLFKMIGGADKADILGRSGPSSEESKMEFLNAVRCAKVVYSATELPFYGIPSANIVFDLDGTGSDLFEVQTLSMAGGSLTIYDYNEIMNIYPLKPSVQIVLKKGEFTIPRSVGIASKVNLSIEMDSNSSVKIFGGNQ